MPVPSVIYVNPLNTQAVLVNFLKDLLSGDFLDAAVVTATLVDQYRNPDPVFNEITLNYTAGSTGNYVGVVPAAFNPKLGSGYTLILDAAQGGVENHWEIPVTVKVRTQ